MAHAAGGARTLRYGADHRPGSDAATAWRRAPGHVRMTASAEARGAGAAGVGATAQVWGVVALALALVPIAAAWLPIVTEVTITSSASHALTATRRRSLVEGR